MIPTEPGLTEGQRRDKESGLIQPWFVHPALDEIETWDLAGKHILEWGGGASTAWWATKVGPTGCVRAIEHLMYADDDRANEWYARLASLPTSFPWVTVHRLEGEEYLRIPEGKWDIVIVDGEPTHLRTGCLERALALPRPVTIICDNWMQDFVYDDREAEVLMEPYPGTFYVQEDHTDHAGQGWQTAIWRLT